MQLAAEKKQRSCSGRKISALRPILMTRSGGAKHYMPIVALIINSARSQWRLLIGMVAAQRMGAHAFVSIAAPVVPCNKLSWSKLNRNCLICWKRLKIFSISLPPARPSNQCHQHWTLFFVQAPSRTWSHGCVMIRWRRLPNCIFPILIVQGTTDIQGVCEIRRRSKAPTRAGTSWPAHLRFVCRNRELEAKKIKWLRSRPLAAQIRLRFKRARLSLPS